MKDTLTVDQVSNDRQLQQILTLQRANLKSALTNTEIEKEGFVTCEHDITLLKKMNIPDPHIICRTQDRVVGYCLVMSPNWRNEVKVLQSMFEKIDGLEYKGRLISFNDYIVMGQVCIDRKFRSRGLFRRMYNHFKDQLSGKYSYCITEVDRSNTRSLDAHHSLGFTTLLCFDSNDGHEWELLIWDWSQ